MDKKLIAIDNLIVENARLIFKNFSGKATQFNREGDRNFCFLIEDPDLAERLTSVGWNVKTLSPREEGEAPNHYIQVTVKYGDISPKIYLVTRKAKTMLTDDTIGSLDFVEMANVDLIVRPYNWEVNGKMGVKAYVKTMYVTIVEDEFTEKYAEKEYPKE